MHSLIFHAYIHADTHVHITNTSYIILRGTPETLQAFQPMKRFSFATQLPALCAVRLFVQCGSFFAICPEVVSDDALSKAVSEQFQIGAIENFHSLHVLQETEIHAQNASLWSKPGARPANQEHPV